MMQFIALLLKSRLIRLSDISEVKLTRQNFWFYGNELMGRHDIMSPGNELAFDVNITPSFYSF